MRADRLLSMLMILQSRGKVTAREMATELEVSERTVHRDINALSAAGVPVYAERGPGGGFALVERYRSDLTGLTRDEVRALFMMSIPPALAELGFERQLRGAMLKLSASLPSTLKEHERGVRQLIHIDPDPWESKSPTGMVADLQVLQDALWGSRMLRIRHTLLMRPDVEPLEARMSPYGLVAKAGTWYLVGRRQDHIAVIRVDRILDVEMLDAVFERPKDFDLVEFWRGHCQDELRGRPIFQVLADTSPDLIPALPLYLGDRVLIRVLEPPPSEGDRRLKIELEFEHFDQARKALLPLGGSIEVLEPTALRYSMRDFAQQILGVYS